MGLNNISGQRRAAYLHLLHMVMVKSKWLSEGRDGGELKYWLNRWIHACMLLASVGGAPRTHQPRERGTGGSTLALEKALEGSHPTGMAVHELHLLVTQASQLFPGPPALELPIHYNAHRQQRNGSIFFFPFHFLPFNWLSRWKSCFSITQCPRLIWGHLEGDYLDTFSF